MISDLRFALRQLRKNLGFTTVAILTLALGIGACTAIFSVVNSVLLRPLPYPDSERLVVVSETKLPQFPRYSVAPANYFDWVAQTRSFENLAMAGLSFGNLTGAGDPVVVTVGRFTANTLTTFQARPILGRNFTAEEASTRARVVLLSQGLWLRQFGGQAGVVNQTVQLDGAAYTVIGVLPGGFGRGIFPGVVSTTAADLFTPTSFASEAHDRLSRNYTVVGRLRPGVTLEGARSELALVAARLEKQYPLTNAGWGIKLTLMLESAVGDARPLLYSLLGAVGFMLLIACANVANLTLARATARRREISVRLALGASRGRIVRQLLSESVLLAGIGGALGILAAWWGLGALAAFIPDNLPRAAEITLDLRALGFSGALIVLTGLGFGLVPALQASRADLQESLKDGGRSMGSGGGRQRARGALVVAEISVTLVLLVGAGLLIRSFSRLQQVDPGFAVRDRMAVTMSLASRRFATRAQGTAFVSQLEENLAALPGVRSAGVTTALPLSGMENTPYFEIAGRPAGQVRNQTVGSSVSPSYFQAIGIPLLRGRFFNEHDTAASPRVAIISQAMATRFFPGEDPLGQRIAVYGGAGTPTFDEIVGIVGDIKNELSEATKVQTYEPFRQRPFNYYTIVLHAPDGAAGLPAAIRAAVRSVDSGQPIASLEPMTGLLAASIARQRFAMRLFSVFSGLALLLALVGIYGVLAYAVAQRTGEIGIRMALGAQRANVLRLIFLQGGRMVAIGLVCGAIGALIATRFMSSLLFGVSAQDPLTFVGIASLFAGASAVACFFPAWRATKVDPLVALRAQ